MAQRFARNGSGVAVNCAGNKDTVNRADAEQVVDVHYEAVLRSLTEARGLPSHDSAVGKGALGARAVGVDNITPIRFAGKIVCADLTKRSRKYTTVKIVHDGVSDLEEERRVGRVTGWVTHRKWESGAVI